MKLLGARAPLFILLALACLPCAVKAASVFGSVTAIGGNASDIALDESRGVLYIANFGAHTITILAALLILAPAAAFAQKWEFGIDRSAGMLNTVTGAPGSATAGFAPGFVAGGFIGENLYSHISGEIRYEFMQSDLRLTSSGQTAPFTGVAHAIHYDVAYRTGNGESNAHFFVALGGGLKTFVGNGTEEAVQPLSQYGYFTKTKSVKPMGTASAGFIVRMLSKLYLRGEIRAITSPFPDAVLTPPPGVKYGTMLTEIMPTVSIVYGR